MVIREVISINGMKVRLTQERWDYIIYEHLELEGCEDKVMSAISDPDFLFAGHTDELIAVKKYSGIFFVITVYKEKETEGFIITAYTKDSVADFKKSREMLWKKN
jgi:hypothetical protein